ncbi:MAG: beta-N-acetylhexosaminidase, partial [Bacteroidia bacterium]
MKHIFISLIFFATCSMQAQKSRSELPLIPQPNNITEYDGTFTLSQQTKIVFNDPSLKSDVLLLTDYLHKNYGFMLQLVTEAPPGNYISFEKSDKSSGTEGYELNIDKEHVSISAQAGGAGFFYGMQTLIQLLPVQPAPPKAGTSYSCALPALAIKDAPRYSWRGMHLDVCRHFMPKEFVKKYIDLLAMYKMNTFHWHLTEDQGWRIEIKKYPLLTQKAAYRKGSPIGLIKDNKFDTVTHGGFYTQEEIREIVSYAQQRHITIVPEIEMPGHSVAAISAYPFLSCSQKPIDVEKRWGVFDDVYCPRDSTFQFLEDVLTEVMALFPGKYIHIGGDECPKDSWKKCSRCQSRIKTENLKDEHELQSYFIKRIEKFVNSKGRQIIGWDEILEGGLAPIAAVMSWRGTEGGI